MGLFSRKTEILFVCTENICRSPMAEGLLRHHLDRLGLAAGYRVRSAGTHSSQPGASPDPRAVRVAAMSGIKLGRIRAKKVTEKTLVRSDLVIAMERCNLEDLMEICPREQYHKLTLLLCYLPDLPPRDVPDPYYGSFECFVEVFELIERAILSLIPRLGDLGRTSGSEID